MNSSPQKEEAESLLDRLTFEKAIASMTVLSDELDEAVRIHPDIVETAQGINLIKDVTDLVTGTGNPLESHASEILAGAESAIARARSDLTNIRDKIQGSSASANVSLGEIEDLLNNSINAMHETVLSVLIEKNETVGKSIRDHIAGETLSNENAFTGSGITDFVRDCLGSVGVEVGKNLLEEKDRALAHDQQLAKRTGGFFLHLKKKRWWIVGSALLVIAIAVYYFLRRNG